MLCPRVVTPFDTGDSMTSKSRTRAVALAVILGGATFLALTDPVTADGQVTKCYLVACTGQVCVWQEIPCPKTIPEKPEE